MQVVLRGALPVAGQRGSAAEAVPGAGSVNCLVGAVMMSGDRGIGVLAWLCGARRLRSWVCRDNLPAGNGMLFRPGRHQRLVAVKPGECGVEVRVVKGAGITRRRRLLPSPATSARGA